MHDTTTSSPIQPAPAAVTAAYRVQSRLSLAAIVSACACASLQQCLELHSACDVTAAPPLRCVSVSLGEQSRIRAGERRGTVGQQRPGGRSTRQHRQAHTTGQTTGAHGLLLPVLCAAARASAENATQQQDDGHERTEEAEVGHNSTHQRGSVHKPPCPQIQRTSGDDSNPLPNRNRGDQPTSSVIVDDSLFAETRLSCNSRDSIRSPVESRLS